MENKLFIPYELALWAKEKGFDEGCFAKYFFKKRRFQTNTLGDPKNYNNGSYGHDVMSAPMYQQIVDWFKDNHRLQIGELPIPLGQKQKWYINDMSQENGFKGAYIGIDKAIEEAYKLIP